jgi:hypothetical protein
VKLYPGQKVRCVDGFSGPGEFPVQGQVYTVRQVREDFVGVDPSPSPHVAGWYAWRFATLHPGKVARKNRSRVYAGPSWGF